MNIHFTPTGIHAPSGKLADAELHFTEGALAGFKLVGFMVWGRPNNVGLNVTFPARQYSINGERRSYALLRPLREMEVQDRLRQVILDAYVAFAQASGTA
jgi:hypothetical protein